MLNEAVYVKRVTTLLYNSTGLEDLSCNVSCRTVYHKLPLLWQFTGNQVPILPRSTTSHSQQSSIYSRTYTEGSDPFDIRILGNCGETPTNIDIYQLRAFGLPRPLRRFAFFNGCSGWVSIFRGCLRQVRRPAFRHEEIGRKPPPATNRDFSRHFSSATEQFHMRSSTNCAKW